MDMDDALDIGIALDGNVIEAELRADTLEGGVERAERLHVGLRPHMLVLRQHDLVVDVLDRHDRLLEPAVLPGRRGALLGLDGIGIDIVAREAFAGCDQVGADALGHEIDRHGDRRVHGIGAAVRAHRHAAHALDAAADRQIGLAGHDLRRRHIAGVEAGGAEAVDLDAGRLLVVARLQGGEPGDIGALFADRHDAAQDDVVDLRRVQIAAVAQGRQGLAGQIDRRDLVQGAVGLAAAARRAHGVEDVGIGHGSGSGTMEAGDTARYSGRRGLREARHEAPAAAAGAAAERRQYPRSLPLRHRMISK